MFGCGEGEARYPHPEVTLWESATAGFIGVVWSAPSVAVAQEQEGGQCSQERFSEFPKSPDPTAGLKVFRV